MWELWHLKKKKIQGCLIIDGRFTIKKKKKDYWWTDFFFFFWVKNGRTLTLATHRRLSRSCTIVHSSKSELLGDDLFCRSPLDTIFLPHWHAFVCTKGTVSDNNYIFRAHINFFIFKNIFSRIKKVVIIFSIFEKIFFKNRNWYYFESVGWIIWLRWDYRRWWKACKEGNSQRGDRGWPAKPPPMKKLVWSSKCFGDFCSRDFSYLIWFGPALYIGVLG